MSAIELFQPDADDLSDDLVPALILGVGVVAAVLVAWFPGLFGSVALGLLALSFS